MTHYKKGEIVLVPFPFSDRSKMKKRPAVVISSDDYNKQSYDIIIMAITSRISKKPQTGECIITDWNRCGLLKPSVIKPAVTTIENTIVIRTLGTLSTNDNNSVNETIRLLLGLS